MRVTLRTVGAVALEATAAESGGQVVIDGKPDIGGQGRGMRPMEALLSALASCAAMDVLFILRKQRQPVEGLRIEADAERVDEVPARLRSVHLRFVVVGKGLHDGKVQRAVRLSVDKYCSVAASLRDDITVTHEATLEAPA